MKIGEAHKTRSSSLQSANTIGTPMPPAPIVMADRTRKISVKHNLNIIGAQCLVSIAYWRRGTSVCQYPHLVRLTYFHTNRLFNELYKQGTEIVEEKMTATLKSKQTSIATVKYPLLPVASLLTPLIFHYPLPLKAGTIEKVGRPGR
jgi:hypothetical protein